MWEPAMPRETMDGLTGSNAIHQHSHPATIRLATHDDPRRPPAATWTARDDDNEVLPHFG